MLKSIKCYLVYYVLSTIAYFICFPDIRTDILENDLLYGICYTFGGSIWMAVPGMINYWMNVKRGYMKWGTASIISGVSTIIFFNLLYPGGTLMASLTVASLMAVPIGIGQFIALVLVMKIKISKPDVEEIKTHTNDIHKWIRRNYR